MTVYVDNYRVPATVGRIKGRWSHLTADTKEELHAFAQAIGLKREWFQIGCKSRLDTIETCVHWHYDVTDSKRAQALAAGAQSMDIRRWAELCRARRAAFRKEAP
jgi:Protein of unknown function (DUF4031)